MRSSTTYTDHSPLAASSGGMPFRAAGGTPASGHCAFCALFKPSRLWMRLHVCRVTAVASLMMGFRW
jgi:hypothetical protein